MDVVAKSNCVCYSISKTILQNMLGEKYITYFVIFKFY